MKFLSSNRNKVAEINSFGIPGITAELGPDLPEVDGTPTEVIIHKAIAANGNLVEDTSFDIDGMSVGVNIRWVVDQLLTDDKLSGRGASWTVKFGVVVDGYVKIASATVYGAIVSPRGEGFGFDPIFQPTGSKLTLAEMGNLKSYYSARKKALLAVSKNKWDEEIPLEDIPQWDGDYQH